MTDGFNINALLEVLAKHVARQVRAELVTDAVQRRLLTVDQAATYLGRTKEALHHLIGNGKLPVVRSDRRVFLDVRDLDEWIQTNKTEV